MRVVMPLGSALHILGVAMFSIALIRGRHRKKLASNLGEGLEKERKTNLRSKILPI